MDSAAIRALWKCSPLRRVRAIRAPCLLAVGMADRRVPAANALEMYRALRAQVRSCDFFVCLLVLTICTHDLSFSLSLSLSLTLSLTPSSFSLLTCPRIRRACQLAC